MSAEHEAGVLKAEGESPYIHSLAETIHLARWPANRIATPFFEASEDDRQYAYRIARSVLRSLPHDAEAVPVAFEVDFRLGRAGVPGWVGWHRPGPEFSREDWRERARTSPAEVRYRDLYAAAPVPASDGKPAPDTVSVPREALEGLRDAAQAYAEYIGRAVKADDLEQHPYLPELIEIVVNASALLALPGGEVEPKPTPDEMDPGGAWAMEGGKYARGLKP